MFACSSWWAAQLEFHVNMPLQNGHVECLRVAHQLGGAIGISCEYAAANGHVKCLRCSSIGRCNWNFM